MKKLIIIPVMAALLFVAADSFAQGFGVKGSFNMFNLSEKDAQGDKVENKMLPVFDAGVFYEFGIAPEFYIRPELLFAQKGAKQELTEAKELISYLELPILFLYKGGLGDSHVLLGFGPYISYGIIGDHFKNDKYKPLDFGGKLMAGYEFKGGISASLNTSYGLTDIENDDLDSSTKNVGFGLTLGYRFGGK